MTDCRLNVAALGLAAFLVERYGYLHLDGGASCSSVVSDLVSANIHFGAALDAETPGISPVDGNEIPLLASMVEKSGPFYSEKWGAAIQPDIRAKLTFGFEGKLGQLKFDLGLRTSSLFEPKFGKLNIPVLLEGSDLPDRGSFPGIEEVAENIPNSLVEKGRVSEDDIVLGATTSVSYSDPDSQVNLEVQAGWVPDILGNIPRLALSTGARLNMDDQFSLFFGWSSAHQPKVVNDFNGSLQKEGDWNRVQYSAALQIGIVKLSGIWAKTKFETKTTESQRNEDLKLLGALVPIGDVQVMGSWGAYSQELAPTHIFTLGGQREFFEGLVANIHVVHRTGPSNQRSALSGIEDTTFRVGVSFEH